MKNKILFIVLTTLAGMTFQAHANEMEEQSLYERLGGLYSIATVVDDLIERLLVNDTLNANPAIMAARDQVPKAGLKFHLTAQVSQAAGGPQNYTGRTMESSHAHLSITETEWQVLLSEFKATLDKFAVPEKEQNELFAIVDSTKQSIVVAGN